MISSYLSSSSFGRYTRLLKSGSSAFNSFSLYAHDGSIFYSSLLVEQENEIMDLSPPVDPVTVLESEKLYSSPSSKDRNLHCLALGIYDIHQQPLALVVLELSGIDLETGVKEKHINMFTDIVESISLEVRTNTELENMTEALGKTYEELNLVYQAKNSVLNEDGQLDNGLKNLDKLVEDCATSLDVDFTGIYFPQKKIKATYGSFSDTVPGNHNIENLITDFKNYLEENKVSVVLNEMEDPVHHVFIARLQCRYMLIPVFSHNLIVDGFIFVCRPLAAPEFTNAERHLVEMLSNLATKIMQSQFDLLTGLLNRLTFESSVNSLLKQHDLTNSPPILLLLNIQHFKIVNDTCGQSVGNKLLRSLAHIIQQVLGDEEGELENVVARIDGDEFAILLVNSGLQQARNIARIISKKVELFSNDIQRIPAHCNFSIRQGIVEFDAVYEDFTQWMSVADLACNLARKELHGAIHVYADDDKHLLQRRSEMHWFDIVKNATANNRLSLYCQKILPLLGGKPHYEILMRVKDDNGKLTSPVDFINAAERYALMIEIDEWVIEHTLELLSKYGMSSSHPNIVWSLNLSGQSIGREGFLDFIVEQLKSKNIDCRTICFEVTETAAIEQFDSALMLIESLKELGCTFSLDDFGSGLSSFSYLKEIPVDNLKIDGVFVKSIVEDKVSLNMVKAMHSVSKIMGLTTIAEFVENDDILTILKELKVDYAQGYGIHKPECFEDVLKKINHD